MTLTEKLKILTANLEKCERVTRYSTQEENQASTLADGFIDMEGAMIKIVERLIPQLCKTNITSEEVDDIILDIGEELRHILYHINDTKVYHYLN